MNRITINDLQPGTKVYYTGDMANASGVGRVTAVNLDPRWGDDVDIKLDADPEVGQPARTFRRIISVNFSRGPGRRFWLYREWIAKKRASLEAICRDMQRIGDPDATDKRIAEVLAEFDRNHAEVA